MYYMFCTYFENGIWMFIYFWTSTPGSVQDAFNLLTDFPTRDH